jgi:ribosome-binding factor A
MKGQDKKIKFEERILNALNIFLRTSLSDSKLQFMSFTKVELNNDFSEAKVFWDTFDSGKRGQIKKSIESAASKLRSLLAAELKVRHTPSLVMVYDSQFESEQEIDQLLTKEKEEGKTF